MHSQKTLHSQPLHPSSKPNIPAPHPPIKMKQMKKIQNYSFCLDEQIGAGCTSKVYKGKNHLTNQQVAVKAICLQNVNDDIQKQFIKKEVAIMQKIMKFGGNKHLLKLFNVLKTKNNIYIITEMCDGKDLGALLKNRKYFNQNQAQKIISEILSGFVELSALNIIHRDLKPTNIFIKNNIMKIADFGFSIQEENRAQAQQSEFNVGSPYYMAPEALRDNVYSGKSDIWSIGVIAYELVVGSQPWRNPVDKILYEKICNQPIQTLINHNTFPTNVSQTYKNLILQCLKFKPQERADLNFLKNYIIHPPLQQNKQNPTRYSYNQSPHHSIKSSQIINSHKIINFLPRSSTPQSQSIMKSMGNIHTYQTYAQTPVQTNNSRKQISHLGSLDCVRVGLPLLESRNQRDIRYGGQIGELVGFLRKVIKKFKQLGENQMIGVLENYCCELIQQLENILKTLQKTKINSKNKSQLLTLQTYLRFYPNTHPHPPQQSFLHHSKILYTLKHKIHKLISPTPSSHSPSHHSHNTYILQLYLYCYQVIQLKIHHPKQFTNKIKVNLGIMWIFSEDEKIRCGRDPFVMESLMAKCRGLGI